MLHLKYKNINDDTTASLNEFLALDLPIKEGIKIAKISKKINEHIELKREFEKKIFEKYSEKDETGAIKPVKNEAGEIIPNQVYITDPEAYTKDVLELEDVDIEISGEKINLDILGLIKIKPSLLLKLEWLVDIEEEEVTETSKS